jgi:hypothetical protein
MPSSPARRARLVTAREEIADLRHLRRGRHLREYRSARGSPCRQGDGAEGRAGLHPGDSARPPRRLFRGAGRGRGLDRALATEIRHLQRTEVLEAEEYFSEGQKGSSSMPHKRNPVLTENLTGLARMVRAYVTPALEDVALWHERDISHSSVERYIGPDATITLDFALARAGRVVDKLLVYPERMRENLDRTRGLVHSQRVLLALTQAGVAAKRPTASCSATRCAPGTAKARCWICFYRGDIGIIWLMKKEGLMMTGMKLNYFKESNIYFKRKQDIGA